MPQKYGLSEAEYELMEFIWNAGRPLTFGDIEDYLTENLFLGRLIRRITWKFYICADRKRRKTFTEGY